MEIYKFSAKWCGPCKAYKEVFDEVTANYSDLKIKNIDVDDDSLNTQKFNVKSIPTTVICKNGVELNTTVGIITKDELKKLIDQYISI
jgi:thioredoxin 1